MGHVSSSGNVAYRNFAENLFALATRNSSIARTCRNLDINRQQFNKYLNGTVLPNEVTLAKITKYFSVESLELFETPNHPPVSLKEAPIAPPRASSEAISRYDRTLDIMETESANCTLREGVYTCYLPWKLKPNHSLRSIIVVTRIGAKLVFTRMVRHSNIADKLQLYPSTCHDGLVTQNRNRITFVSHERRWEQRISMLNFTFESNMQHNVMTGLLLSFAPSGIPLSCQVAMHYECATTEWRKQFRKCGILSNDDPSIPSAIAAIIQAHFKNTRSVIQAVDLLQDWRS
jgi:hypothetical protein